MATRPRPTKWWMAVLAAALGCAPQSTEKPSLTVSAASDLTNAFREIGDAYEREYGVRVDFNFGSTGNLARQIQQGAAVDVFAAANLQFIDELEKANCILPETKAPYGRGRLAIWQKPNAATAVVGLADLVRPEIRRVSIANPDHAPYGAAARQALERLGLWEPLQDKLVIGENIRQAYQYAETGNVDVGLVALPMCRPGQGRWRLVPEELHEPLEQTLAVVARSPHEAEAIRFARYVNAPAGRAVLRRYGLVLPGESLPQELLGDGPIASPASAP